MKLILLIALPVLGLTACDVKVDNSDPPSKTVVVPGKDEKKVEHNTTIVNPPAEKKVENNTTIVNPPAEKKIEKKEETTIINPPR